jgi:hypothetical protein
VDGQLAEHELAHPRVDAVGPDHEVDLELLAGRERDPHRVAVLLERGERRAHAHVGALGAGDHHVHQVGAMEQSHAAVGATEHVGHRQARQLAAVGVEHRVVLGPERGRLVAVEDAGLAHRVGAERIQPDREADPPVLGHVLGQDRRVPAPAQVPGQRPAGHAAADDQDSHSVLLSGPGKGQPHHTRARRAIARDRMEESLDRGGAGLLVGEEDRRPAPLR